MYVLCCMALVVCFPKRCGACCISHLARCISHLARCISHLARCISHLARCISHLARCRSTRSRRLTRRGSARTRSTRCSRHPCHICAGTGLSPASICAARRDWAHPAHICAGTTPSAEPASHTAAGAADGGGERAAVQPRGRRRHARRGGVPAAPRTHGAGEGSSAGTCKQRSIHGRHGSYDMQHAAHMLVYPCGR